MLKLDNVSKFYYSKGIIASGFTKVNLELKIGEFVAITGESGSGKSTLLNVISGLDSYEEGEMYINGEETSHYTEKDFEEYRRKYIANIFQSFNLVNSYTVYQNVELVLLLNGYKKKDIKQKVLDIINQVGLSEFKNTKVSKLSGGQKQRVAIARAMVKDTPIIVADEPTGNLDSKSAKDVIEILKKVAKDKLVVIVTHNIEQVEEYATRIIKMHDGRIIENREVKKAKEIKDPEISKFTKITNLNKYRLGIRNTFNIVSKFLLLFAVFFFMSSALLAEYASFKFAEDEELSEGISVGFSDLSPERILIKKTDKTYFTDDDYAKIQSLPNVDYIVKDDILIDSTVSVYNEQVDYSGNVISIDNYKMGELDKGRMPENENEIVIQVYDDDFYSNLFGVEVLDQQVEMDLLENEQNKTLLKIVGIKYDDSTVNYNAKIYVANSILDKIRMRVNQSYSNVKTVIKDKELAEYYMIMPSDNVAKGHAVVYDDMRYEFDGSSLREKIINITNTNIYYTESLELYISDTFTKANFKKLTGYERYEDGQTNIYINREDYNSLFDKPSYQSSVYLKDAKKADEALVDLQNLGLVPKKVTDYSVDDFLIFKQIIKITKVIVTIILVIALFFISYLIIKIILKSRNIYYTTLRMLGATFNSVRRILDIELFVNSTLAYSIILLIIYFAKVGVINYEYASKLAEYVNIREFIILYVVVAIMSRLISRRFSKKLFTKSTITTYNEEV